MKLPGIKFLIILAALPVGCAPPAPTGDIYRDFQSESSDIRLSACVRAGDAKDSQAVPYLVDRLSDSELSVRVYAIMALERITGTRMGYEYYLPTPERLKAIEWWRQWLDAGRPPMEQWLKKITAKDSSSQPASAPTSSHSSSPTSNNVK